MLTRQSSASRTLRPRSAIVLALALSIACGDSTAPEHGRTVVPPPAALNVEGTYALQSVQGSPLPGVFPAVYGPQYTVYGGCLALGAAAPGVQTKGDSSWTILVGSANESWFFVKAESDSAAANPQYCPAFTSRAGGGSRYAIAGDSGWVLTCGLQGCDSTQFLVTETPDRRTISLRNLAGEVFVGH